MTSRVPQNERGRPMDIVTLTEDDLLLDRLGRGEPVADGGDIASMLSAWRATLPEPGPAGEPLVRAALAATGRPRAAGRFARLSLGVAAGLVLAGSGVTVAAAHAGPGSPLWPITRLVYGDEAESRMATEAAGRALADARVAAERGRYEEASRLLGEAARLMGKVSEPADVQRLSTQADAVRALFPGGVPAGPDLVPGASPLAPPSGSPQQPPAPTVRPPQPTMTPAPAPDTGIGAPNDPHATPSPPALGPAVPPVFDPGHPAGSVLNLPR